MINNNMKNKFKFKKEKILLLSPKLVMNSFIPFGYNYYRWLFLTSLNIEL